MNEGALTPEEINRWRNFRFMAEETGMKVSRKVSSASGLSAGQFGILGKICAMPTRELRQQELADAMLWDRTRLSHQLTRMEKRGLIERRKRTDGGTLIGITAKGETEKTRLAPTLAQAVRTHFLGKLTEEHLRHLTAILTALRT